MPAVEPTWLIKRALAHEPVPTTEQLAEADQAEKEALRAIGSNGASVIVNIILDMMYSGRALWSSMFPTMCTVLNSDGFLTYVKNPEFFLSVDPMGRRVVIVHEALHVLRAHHHHTALREIGIDPADPVATVAFEAHLNRDATLIMGGGKMHVPMPTIDGKPTGVDWEQVHRDYAKDLKGQGLTPLDLPDFFHTELTTYRELHKMAKPPAQPKQNWCGHSGQGQPGAGEDCPSCGKPQAGGTGQEPGKGKGKGKPGKGEPDQPGQSGQPGDGAGTCACPASGSGPYGMDPEAAEKLAEQAIGETLREALNGNKAAVEDLKRLMDGYSDSEAVSSAFGSMGLGKLFGQAPPPMKINWIEQYLTSIIDARLRPAARLVRKEKIWWDDQLAFRGPKRVKRGIVAYDTSASMPSDIVRKFTQLLGQADDVEIQHWCFDAAVWPAADTEGIRGGGGTSFRPVYDLACKDDEDVHFLLYITDGYAPPLVPDGEVDAEKVIWLISPGGDDWIARDPLSQMTSVVLDSWSDLGLEPAR